MTIFDFLKEKDVACSMAMVRRWFNQRAVTLNGLTVTDKFIKLTPGDTVGVGRTQKWTYNEHESSM